MKMRIGPILIIVGITLLIFGTVAGMITVVADNTPPTTPYMVSPQNGKVYVKLTIIVFETTEAESSVESAYCKIGVTTYTLNVGSADPSGWVSCSLSIPVMTTPGVYNFEAWAVNTVGLESTHTTGTFTIYTDLQGTWYVNDQEITDTAQVIYVPTLTLDYKFVKTAGIDDSYITCTVSWTGTETGSITLTHVSAGTWTGSNTFTSGGSYTVTLLADDGTKTITFSILDVHAGESEPWLPDIELPSLHPLQWLGLATTGFGIIVTAVEAKKKK